MKSLVDINDDPVSCASRHALFWMAAANVVGVWLSLLLIFPDLGRLAGEWTYGRWVPLHLNWHLYGWTALPLVGLLFQLFPGVRDRWSRSARVGILLWSSCLILGGMDWLGGTTSGKIFLDWSGFLRVLFPLAILFLWSVLARSWWAGPGRSRWAGAGLLVLLGVPFGLYFAADPSVYPPVDRSTGGPSGASLLNSTLSVVFLFLVLGRCLGGKTSSGKIEKGIWVFFLLNLMLGVLAEGFPPDHRHPGQIACLSTLLLWPAILAFYFKKRPWPFSGTRWRTSTMAWFFILALHGVSAFLPGILDEIKFTNALVAHSHLAMAGFTTSFLIFLLQQILSKEESGCFENRIVFWGWQGATLGYFVVMTLAGVFEAGDPSFTIHSGLTRSVLFSFRVIAGVAMLGISIHWWRGLCRLREIS